MNIFKVNSIRKRTRCYYCDGKGMLYEDMPKKYHSKCSVCNGTGYTQFKMNIHLGKFEFEAMIVNRYGKRRKTHKWCVEVFENMLVSESDKELIEMGYKVGQTVGVHHYQLDGWGKSIDQAYTNAFNNVKKFFKIDRFIPIDDNKVNEEVIKPVNNENN